MSDPGAPSYTQLDWAEGPNYPAGAEAWSGQPMRVEPIDPTITPGDTYPAENMNWIIARLSEVDNDAALYIASLRTYLNENKGGYHIINRITSGSDQVYTGYGGANPTFTSATEATVSLGTPALTLATGDIVEVELQGFMVVEGVDGIGYGTLNLKKEDGGGTTTLSGAQAIASTSLADVRTHPFNIKGSWVYAPGDTGEIFLGGKVNVGGGGVSLPTLYVSAGLRLTVTQYRAGT